MAKVSKNKNKKNILFKVMHVVQPICTNLQDLLSVHSGTTCLNLITLLYVIKVREQIEYKILSCTIQLLFHQPSYLSNMLTVQSNVHNTRSSKLVTLHCPTVARAAIAKRSFFHSSPALWNSLPSLVSTGLCQ